MVESVTKEPEYNYAVAKFYVVLMKNLYINNEKFGSF